MQAGAAAGGARLQAGGAAAAEWDAGDDDADGGDAAASTRPPPAQPAAAASVLVQRRPASLQSMASAALAVHALLATSLGPLGAVKTISNELGEMTVTNDGACLLRSLRFEHPACRVIVDTALSQDRAAGDGTTSAALLCATLVRAGVRLMLEQRLHVWPVVCGFQLACERALDAMRDSSFVPDGDGAAAAAADVARTVLASKRSTLLGAGVDLEVLVRALLSAHDDSGQGRLHVVSLLSTARRQPASAPVALLDGVPLRVAAILGDRRALLSDSGVVVALALPQAQRVRRGEVAALSAADVERARAGRVARVLARLRERSQVSACVVTRHAAELLHPAAVALGVALLVLDRSGSLAEASALLGLAMHVARVDDEAVGDDESVESHGDGVHARSCSISVLQEEPQSAHEQQQHQQQQQGFGRHGVASALLLVRVKDAADRTLALGSASPHMVDETARSIEDVRRVLALVRSRATLVAGAGAAEASAAAQLLRACRDGSIAEDVGSAVVLACEAFADALLCVPRALAVSAGMDAVCTVDQLVRSPAGSHAGVLVRDRRVGNAREARVWEPLAAKEASLRGATEGACTLLRTDALVLAAEPLEDRVRRLR